MLLLRGRNMQFCVSSIGESASEALEKATNENERRSKRTMLNKKKRVVCG